MNFETVWSFKTARFTIVLQTAQDFGYQYDGDDENGETQASLDCGDFVAFDSRVVVKLGSIAYGSDYLSGSVYAADETEQFWAAHRDANPMNRNCSIMRAAHPAGPNVSIGHYFPDMVRQAVAEARRLLAEVPRMRAA